MSLPDILANQKIGQDALARLAGLSRPTVYAAYRGKSVQIASAQKIAAALRVDLRVIGLKISTPAAERPIAVRLENLSMPEPNSGCTLFIGAIDRGGYGNFSIKSRYYSAHRASYEIHVGKIPEGLDIDHLCRNRACINPTHLEPVTPRENNLRSHRQGKFADGEP